MKRGTLRLRGSIPALAGKPSVSNRSAVTARRVYPRARGEAWQAIAIRSPDWGLSPRSRGSRRLFRIEVYSEGLSPRSRGSPPETTRHRGCSRSIPALAGKPAICSTATSLPGVYPRARGEASPQNGRSSMNCGLSPRSRGSPFAMGRQSPGTRSIPALAGKPEDRTGSRSGRVRSIPALAGKPGDSLRHRSFSPVYPRARGEAMMVCITPPPGGGLSPRSRGSPLSVETPWRSSGSIPALAGKPVGVRVRFGVAAVYPRARGEAAQMSQPRKAYRGLSPRSRGSPSRGYSPRRSRRSIPALAGKPGKSATWRRTWRVYPRARGEARTGQSDRNCSGGLSPRSRGSRPSRSHPASPAGSIPALAGKPTASRGLRSRTWVYPRARGEARAVSAG